MESARGGRQTTSARLSSGSDGTPVRTHVTHINESCDTYEWVMSNMTPVRTHHHRVKLLLYSWLLCESITLLHDHHKNLLLYCMTNARQSSGSDGTPYITKLLHDYFVKFLLYCMTSMWNYCFTSWTSCEIPILLPYGFSTWLHDRVEGTHAAAMGRWCLRWYFSMICIYIYTYVYIYVYIYYICICMYICMYIYTYM